MSSESSSSFFIEVVISLILRSVGISANCNWKSAKTNWKPPQTNPSQGEWSWSGGLKIKLSTDESLDTNIFRIRVQIYQHLWTCVTLQHRKGFCYNVINMIMSLKKYPKTCWHCWKYISIESNYPRMIHILSWNHNHISKLISQLVILLLQAGPFQCLFCHLEIRRTVSDCKYRVQNMRFKNIAHPWAGEPTEGCLQVLPDPSPFQCRVPNLQPLSFSPVPQSLWERLRPETARKRLWIDAFLTQLLRSIKRVRLGQDSRNRSAADIVSSGCSLPLY